MKTGQSPLGDLRPPTMLKPRDVPGGRLRWMMWHSAPLGSVLLLNEVREGGREGEREKGREGGRQGGSRERNGVT